MDQTERLNVCILNVISFFNIVTANINIYCNVMINFLVVGLVDVFSNSSAKSEGTKIREFIPPIVSFVQYDMYSRGSDWFNNNNSK